MISVLASAALLSAGCRRVDDVAWSKYTSIPSDGWDPVNVIPFFPWPEDSVTSPSESYSLLLSVRFRPGSNPGPLHLSFLQEDDSGWEKRDTLRLEIDTPATTPTGKGSYGVYETIRTIEPHIRLRPGYSVEIQSLSDPEYTKGIIDIGLILSMENQ